MKDTEIPDNAFGTWGGTVEPDQSQVSFSFERCGFDALPVYTAVHLEARRPSDSSAAPPQPDDEDAERTSANEDADVLDDANAAADVQGTGTLFPTVLHFYPSLLSLTTSVMV